MHSVTLKIISRAHDHRIVCQLCCGLLILLTHISSVPAADLNQLVADYRAYKLPAPDLDDLFVTRRYVYELSGDDEIYRQEAMFIISNDKSRFWYGCELFEFEVDGVNLPKPLTRADVLKTTTTEVPYTERGRFPTFPDLALAVQCHIRGHADAANAFLARSREPWSQTLGVKLPPRPRDDREALALLAWNYWCTRFASERKDRAAIIDHLQTVIDRSLVMKTIARKNVIADMKSTIAKHNPPTDKEYSSAVDSLLNLDVTGNWAAPDGFHARNAARQNKSYKLLQKAGLDAVPTLIDHLDDYRLTRCIQTCSGERYTWNVRIADVVAQLLNELVSEEFSYDFLEQQGRGITLDNRHVEHWWSEQREGLK